MQKSEKRIEQEIQLAAAEEDSVIWKNNVGSAYRGKLAKFKNQKILTSIQLVRFGLGNIKGSSDQIGLTQVEITPEMVGRKIAVFTAVEVKRDKFGAYGATDEQRDYLKMVKKMGGIACLADCYKDVKDAIRKFKEGV